MNFTALFLSLFISLNVFAANWAEDFEALKGVPRSYSDSGAICEEIARLDMQKKYPAPQYKVEVGIAYSDADGTIGELDVIVFDRGQVTLIGEVKCWKSLNGGLKKARDQRARFLKNLRSGKALDFTSTSTHQRFSPNAFKDVQDFITIGQLGARAAGYDLELGYTLEEMHQHTDDMIGCQQSGECVRP